MTANISVAIALAGGFAMLPAASGTPFDLNQQIGIVRSRLSGTDRVDRPAVAPIAQASELMAPPSDLVLLKWANGKAVQPI